MKNWEKYSLAKTKFFPIGLVVLLMVFSGPSTFTWAKEQIHPSPEWFLCKVDGDCVDITFSCSGATVNKSYKKEAFEFYSLENARTNCESRPSSGKGKPIPFRTFCQSGKCQKEGTNPKVGFS